MASIFQPPPPQLIVDNSLKDVPLAFMEGGGSEVENWGW